ncbi:Signal transduction histidine kinase [Acetitomaculum ruminis DSM 5522]|uniref:Circadian input-output histidine kinase CikA n=1 Tax=Acetitomaculum ruminis DSM 5522 TaxID=1120918 RepID=A0A1I0W5W5_9FIRM|nr:response regulator [Acetitomaculum ruminis]SFA83737.1 Signal transduction histidine kinase [Acetitomaculum ruminis DSM 5522]
MDDLLYFGRVMTKIIYAIEGVCLVAVGALLPNVQSTQSVALFVLFILSCLSLRLARRKNVPFLLVTLMEIIYFDIFGIITSLMLGNLYLIFLLIMIQWMESVLYGSTKVCNCMVIIHTIIILAFSFWNLDKFEQEYWSIACFIAFSTVVLAAWISGNVVKIINFNTKKYTEQETGLNDIINVLEAKCDDAKESINSKSRFLSNMSHEMRTLINTIMGMNEMILRENEDLQITEYAQNIENSGEIMLSLINDVLDYSKIESGEMEINSSQYTMTSMLNKILSIILPKTKEVDLDFNLEVTADMPDCLMGDEARLTQILINILNISVRWTEMGSISLKVGYERTDQENLMLEIRISDTGKGIKPEDLEYLFDSFIKLDKEKNNVMEGSGLGLTITKCLVEAMDGKIEVNSQYQKGTEFIITIPQGITDIKPIGDIKKILDNNFAKREEYAESFRAPDVKVLVVDDSKVNLKVVSLLLKNTEVKITEALSGEEAIQKLKEDEFDLVLLDHMMPEMDGVETLKIIRDNNIADKTPVIALTANAVARAREIYIAKGFCDYLSKPVGGKDLESALIKWLPEDKVYLVKEEEAEVIKEKTSKYKEFVRKEKQREEKASIESVGEKIEKYQKLYNSLNRLKECLSDWDYDKAEEVLEDILKHSYEENIQQRLNIAYMLLENMQPEDALNEIEEIILENS